MTDDAQPEPDDEALAVFSAVSVWQLATSGAWQCDVCREIVGGAEQCTRCGSKHGGKL